MGACHETKKTGNIYSGSQRNLRIRRSEPHSDRNFEKAYRFSKRYQPSASLCSHRCINNFLPLARAERNEVFAHGKYLWGASLTIVSDGCDATLPRTRPRVAHYGSANRLSSHSRSFPVVVMVILPCFTPRVEINCSPARFTCSGFPLMINTSRQL